jgi:conjugal transfer ATP-binding protein TraC
MMSVLALPFVSLKSWLTHEEALATPSPVADENHFTTRQEYNRLSDLLPWTGYWEREKLFAIEGETDGSIEAIGYAIEMNPQTGASDDMARLIQEIYRDMPPGAGVQVQLWGSPDIEGFLNDFQKVCRPERLQDDAQRALIARMTAERTAHYRRASLIPPVSSRPSVMRHYRVLLSVTMPVKDVEYRTLERVMSMRDAQVSKLKTYYQFDRVWGAEDLIAWVRTMLNPAQRSPDPVSYDDGQSLRYQMITRDTVASVGRLGITLRSPEGDAVCIRAHSAQGYPKHFDLHQVTRMLGDADKGSMGYPCPFLITMGAQILNYDEHKNLVQIKTARAIQVSESPMGKALPDVGKRAADWKLLQDAYDEGGGAVRLYHQVLLFPMPDAVAEADESARAIWRSMGFALTPDTYMQTQALMSALPMALGPSLQRDIRAAQRFSTKTIGNAANLSPVLGEWRGTGTPVLTFTGRNGQTIGVNLFDNPSGNFNGCVVGTSGSGKSAFLNEVAERYLAMGAKVWIIDVGRSYEKLCHALGGQYIEFTKDANVVLNPFTMVNDIDEDMEMLKPLVAQMISPSRQLSDYELSQVEMAIRGLWDDHGARSSIDLLAERLKLACHDGGTLESGEEASCDPRIRDLAVQLASYTSAGSYGHYFEGQHTINFNSNLVVLELEELKSKKDLQSVALFILMYRITQEMYLAPREQPKVVILDEAWDLLTGGQTGDFIEAGYRRARKYGGAFLTGTQGINDYYRSAASQAALENADWMFMLRQKQESIAKLEEKLAFTPHMSHLVSSLRTEQGSYSEVFISCGQAGYGVGMLLLDKFSQLMGSANARDFSAVNQKRAQGLSMADAVDAVLQDRKVTR